MDYFGHNLSLLMRLFHEKETSFEHLVRKIVNYLLEATGSLDRTSIATAAQELDELETKLKRQVGDEERCRRMRLALMAALLTIKYGDGGLADGKKVIGPKKLQVAEPTQGDLSEESAWSTFRRTVPRRQGLHRIMWDAGLSIKQLLDAPPSLRRLIGGLLDAVPQHLDDDNDSTIDSLQATVASEFKRDGFMASAALLFVLSRVAQEDAGIGWATVEAWVAHHPV